MASMTLSVFFRRRSAELFGVFLLAIGTFLFLSFISYNRFDPSLNLSIGINDTPVVKNWCGKLGAYIAVPLIDIFGISAFLAPLALIAWGWKLLRKTIHTGHVMVMFITWLIAIPSLSALASLLDSSIDMSESWPSTSAGGFLGAYLKNHGVHNIGLIGYVAVVSIVAIITVYFASGLSVYEWWRGIQVAGSMLYISADYLFRITHYAIYRFRQLLQGREAEDEDDVVEHAPRIRREKAAKKREIKTPRKIVERESKHAVLSRESAQASFDINMSEDFQLPPLNLLKTAPSLKKKDTISQSALDQNAEMLEKVLEDFGVNGKITEVRPGPVVTLYALEPAAGTRASRVIGLADDISRSMSSISARIAVIPGQNTIGIELPNAIRQTVYLKEMLESDAYSDSTAKLPLILGKDISGSPVVIDLAKTPHMLIAGTTGSGKSVGVNAMILSLLYRYSPAECKFIMVDPKMLELSMYQDIPHLLTPVVTEPGKAVVALKWTVKEMENRYRLMSNQGVRNIEGYNKKILDCVERGEVLERTVQTGFDTGTGKPIYEKVPLDMQPLPFIVVIVDEMADLMLVAGKDIEHSVQRLAQMARAAGIHIILATQRPSVDVITGVIKANFPTRISFQVTSKIDSRTVLGEQGAEQLLGQGDMLYMAGGSRITRVHGPFVDDKEVERVVNFLRAQGAPSYIEEVTIDESESGSEGDMLDESDDLYTKALNIVRDHGKASTSFIQRQLKIGYNRAADLIDRMEQEGVISAADHVGRREVLR